MFNWESAPYQLARNAQICDVPGVGRLHAYRVGPGQRTFAGKINGKRVIAETRTIDEAKAALEAMAKVVTVDLGDHK